MFVLKTSYDPEPGALAYGPLIVSGGCPIPSRNARRRGQPLLPEEA
jgi:hypothetical protein